MHQLDEQLKRVEEAFQPVAGTGYWPTTISSQDVVQVLAGLRTTLNFMKAFDEFCVLPHPEDLPEPQPVLKHFADEIDCGGYPDCDHAWYESDTNAGGCTHDGEDGYCAQAMACALRDACDAARKVGGE